MLSPRAQSWIQVMIPDEIFRNDKAKIRHTDWFDAWVEYIRSVAKNEMADHG